MPTESELKPIVQTGFDKIRDTFYENHKFEEKDEDNSPILLSYQDMVESLPPSIRVIEIIGPPEHKQLKNGKGFLFHYDLNRLKSNHVEFCGTVNYDDPEQLESLIVKKFKIDKNEIGDFAYDLCKNFDIIGWESPSQLWYIHFISDDIMKNPEIFYERISFIFLKMPIDTLYEKFQREQHPNYNKIFNLASDPVLSLQDLLKSSMTEDDRFSLQSLQKNVADIQLIPAVPEMVKRVFKRAKDLFIFGYFKYEFFTISQHYILLALESAIKTRYIASLNGVATLTDKQNPTLKYQLHAPTHNGIEQFIINGHKTGWNKNRLLVNNEPFPSSGKKLVKWLLDKGLIRKWEEEFYDIGLQFRNNLSHLEFASILPPSPIILRRIADQINYIFYVSQNEIQTKQKTLENA